MKIGLSSILILLLYSSQLFCLNKINTSLFEHAQKYDAKNIEINELYQHLKSATKNESEEVEIFFYWIAQNINYDIEDFLDKATFNTEDILISKKGVCQDFAELFKKLCNLAQIECYVISGYAKGYGYSKDSSLEINHAWNVVKTKGIYKFVDITWGSGYVDLEDGKLKYFRKISLDQVLVNSNSFRETHLPGDPKWQLLNTPISYSKFISNQSFKNMTTSFKANFQYKEKIEAYKQLSIAQQELEDYINICKFNPTDKNFIQLGNSYYRMACKLSTSNYDEEHLEEAKLYFKMALKEYNKVKLRDDKLFEKAKNVNSGISYCNYRIYYRK